MEASLTAPLTTEEINNYELCKNVYPTKDRVGVDQKTLEEQMEESLRVYSIRKYLKTLTFQEKAAALDKKAKKKDIAPSEGLSTKLLMYEPGEIYFHKKKNELTNQRTFDIKNLPENTLFTLVQAQYQYVKNLNNNDDTVNETNKKGVFIAELEVVGQILPGNPGLPPEEITQSKDLVPVEEGQRLKVSNPINVMEGQKVKFILNKKSCDALFVTSADEGPHKYFTYGKQEKQGKGDDQITSSYGRFERKPMARSINVWANSSLQKLILAQDRNSEASLFFYRKTTTDSLHAHNMQKMFKTQREVVYFEQIPNSWLIDNNVVKEVRQDGKDNSVLKNTVNLEWYNLMNNHGKQVYIDLITKMLLLVLKTSEHDLEDNYIKGNFKHSVPSRLRINPHIDLTKKSSSTAVGPKRKARMSTAGGKNVKRDRSRSPVKEVESPVAATSNNNVNEEASDNEIEIDLDA